VVNVVLVFPATGREALKKIAHNQGNVVVEFAVFEVLVVAVFVDHPGKE
jgi:hypothetical protein